MSINVHILVPFYRKYLYKTLIHYYGKLGVIFHPICDAVDIEPFKDNELDWVKPLLCQPLKPNEQCYAKFNHFINSGEVIIDDDYYGFMGDDDMIEEGLSDELKKKNSDVIYISNYRGDRIPFDDGCPHPVHPIIPREPKDVAPCFIGLGEFYVKGHILKKVRFNTTKGDDDGRFAQNLLNVCDSIEFMPDWFTFGNYFQPRRHTNPDKFLKPNWELPEIIK